MADDAPQFITRLLPEDEYTHTPDAASNYNESMYFNVFDHGSKVGGWFRLGNRPNEGQAEMSVCLYLPGGRIGFMFGRPKIANNDAMNAGGLTYRRRRAVQEAEADLRGQALPAGAAVRDGRSVDRIPQ